MSKVNPCHSPPLSSVSVIGIVFCKPFTVSRVDNQPSQPRCTKTPPSSLSYRIAIISHFLSFFLLSFLLGAWRSSCPCPGTSGMLSTQDCPFKAKAYALSFQKLETENNWESGDVHYLLGQGHINLLQTEPEMASNLNGLDITCTVRGSPNSHSQDQKPKWPPCSLYDQDQNRAFPSPSRWYR